MIPADIIRKVRAIEIRTRRVVNEVLSGEYHSVFKGRGMEFSEVREYSPGDEIRTIDWNVTARCGRPFVKVFKEERELTLMLVVDASGSNDFGTQGRMKGETAVELCALLAFSAIQNNDKVGLIIFTSEVEKYIPPKKGRNHVLRVIRELLYFRPVKRGTDVGGALAYLNRTIKKKAVVCLVSDFFDAKDFRSPLRVAARKHDLIAVSVTDPREETFPATGLTELQDAESGETLLVDASHVYFRTLMSERAETRRRQRNTLFRSAGVENVQVTTEKDYVEPLMRFFRSRGRRR
ncbi:MAG: hypothetical protein A2293_09740 [Elusimicrobia bacterium RIFOXYB2_FULL_49_7]|nr:MAG: hypothetical protein A2293_09740 [Elusimicrobia bacterium RIFOXYB2_FULL_49_7]